MAKLPIVDFRNKKDPKGYRLGYNPQRFGEGVQVILRNGPVDKPWEETLTECPSLNGNEFFYFAKNVKDARGALEFAREFGPLYPLGHYEDGDPVRTYISKARSIRKLLEMNASGEWSEWGLQFIDAHANIGIRTGITRDPMTKALGWRFHVENLHDALWAQFLQAIVRGAPLRICRHCATWFEAGVGAGRRADALYCCDEHRDKFNSLKRSRRA